MASTKKGTDPVKLNTAMFYEVMTVSDMLVKDISNRFDSDKHMESLRSLARGSHTRRYWLSRSPDQEMPDACIESAVWAERDHVMYVVVCDNDGHHHALQTGKKIPSALDGMDYVVASSAYSEKVRKVRKKYCREGAGSYADESKLIARLIELGEGD